MSENRTIKVERGAFYFMNNKKLIFIPEQIKFEKWIGVKGRKINVELFIPSRSSNRNGIHLEMLLSKFKSFEIIGSFTNEVGYQKGPYRLRKLHDLYCRREVDLIISYSKEDAKQYESDLGNVNKGIMNFGTMIYCIRECVLIRACKCF